MDVQTVRDRAVEVMGCQERAEVWLETTNQALGGSPEEVARTQEGACRVLSYLRSLEVAYPE